MLYWVYLVIAIAAEITSTLSMKYASMTDEHFGYFVMYIMITCSYICLAMAIKRIALGVAYALWEGIGTFFITIFSIILFNESMNWVKALGLLTLLLGLSLVKSGTSMKVISKSR
ncbi:MAG: multidrug/spermidine efflux SMR transporter subunit MdtJ [Candidatus Schmidhempelia sp.]|nr:multidrug/spermidine efflux SMR transporter subunit MdtJ [Candidatus Schmidhempelia sp.]